LTPLSTRRNVSLARVCPSLTSGASPASSIGWIELAVHPSTICRGTEEESDRDQPFR